MLGRVLGHVARIDEVLRRAVDAAGIPGVVAMAILPFADPRALTLYGQFERGICDALDAA